MTTGEGGALTTNDQALAKKIRALRNHGIVLKNKKPDFVYAGLNYRMTDFQAVLGIPQLHSIENAIKKRKRIAQIYTKTLSGCPKIKLPENFADRRMVYQTYHILLNKPLSRQKIIRNLRSFGIETNLGAQAIPLLTYYQKKYHIKTKDVPEAAFAYQQGLALPIGDHLTEKNAKFICEKLLASL
jgi:dTDP-4-amino-4,6-dideoxygalactose transaminase